MWYIQKTEQNSVEAFWIPVWSRFSFLFNTCLVCVYSLLIQNVTSVSMAISPTLIREQLLQINPNKSHCEGNLKTSLRSGCERDFHQNHLHSSGNRISTRETLVLTQKNLTSAQSKNKHSHSSNEALRHRLWGRAQDKPCSMDRQ